MMHDCVRQVQIGLRFKFNPFTAIGDVSRLMARARLSTVVDVKSCQTLLYHNLAKYTRPFV